MVEPLQTKETKDDVRAEFGNDPRFNEVLEELWRMAERGIETRDFWGRLRKLAEANARSTSEIDRDVVTQRVEALSRDMRSLLQKYSRL